MSITNFETLGLQRWLALQCKALALIKPTEIQKKCIPAVLRSKNVVGGAITGSGKTAAFVLPIIQLLSEELYGIFSLVLTPSRELAYQILDQFVAFGAPIGIRTAIVIGGVSHGDQMGTLTSRPHVVVATPGRLKMLLETFIEVKFAFKNLRFLVLDEADRLLEGDLFVTVMACVELLNPLKQFCRTLLFSSTLNDKITNVKAGILPRLGIKTQDSLVVFRTNDSIDESTQNFAFDNDVNDCISKNKKVDNINESNLNSNQNKVQNSLYATPDNLAHKYLFVPNSVKLPFTVCLLRVFSPDSSSIIFCNSCFRSEVVRLSLQLLGFPVCSLNSLLNQQKRLTNLALFKAGIAKILVATDIAARGLDIPFVENIIHYDFPKLSVTYVHRIGRTARAGKSGSSIAIITENDISLVHKVERRIKKRLNIFKHDKVNDDEVVGILDDVSSAKIEAKMQVEEQFREKSMNLKEIGRSRRSEINKIIRLDGNLNKTFLSDMNIDSNIVGKNNCNKNKALENTKKAKRPRQDYNN